MAYAPYSSSSPNPPVKLIDTLGSTAGGGWRLWVYRSTHLQTDVGASDFISDGQALGMTVGDTVLAIGSTTYKISYHAVTSVGSTFTGLSAGLVVSSAS